MYFFFCQQNAKGKGLWWCPWDFSFLSLWRHTVGFVFSYAFPLRKYSWDLQLTHSYSLPLISPLFTSFLSSNLLSSSSPSPLAPAVHPVSLFPLAPFHPTFTPHYPTPSLLPLALPLSFSAWTFGRGGGGRCRPVLYIRCQASDRDSGLWVNTLTASTEDILSVKWSLHYSRWKETGKETERQRSEESHAFTIALVLQCKGLHLFTIGGQEVKMHLQAFQLFLA